MELTDERAPGDETWRAFAQTDGAATALRLSAIDKSFGVVHAVKAATIEVRLGEIHALVGENGAGKSTMMAIAAGELRADSGTVEIAGTLLEQPDPQFARALGFAIVHQEPALVPDLTVDENLRASLDDTMPSGRTATREWSQRLLSSWSGGARIDGRMFVRDLTPRNRFIVEIARSVAQDPKVLVLDEPTEHLSLADIEQLFERVRELAARGCAVLYISHRLHEVKQIADRITVLRDGAVRGAFEAASVTEREIVDLIVGRSLGTIFPDKAQERAGTPVLEIDDLSGVGFSGLSLALAPGEVVGFAGIEGSGQRDAIRALAGLNRPKGEVRVTGRRVSCRSTPAATRAGFGYVPNDRHTEGALFGLSVRENMSVSTIGDYAHLGVVDPRAELTAVVAQTEALAVKTPSVETEIDDLSGGNQQKVILSRVLASRPKIILADEPAQGVDVGARVEIYRILRQAAADGVGVVIVSSDFVELAGLCDRVVVFSRGVPVRELSGDGVVERSITETVLTATTVRETAAPRTSSGAGRWLRGFARSDLSPSAILAVVSIALAIYAGTVSSMYLTGHNWQNILLQFATLGLIALGQQVVMMIGAIDLSVGPLMGFIVVLATFVLTPGESGPLLALGLVVMILVGLVVGFLNWLAVTALKMPPLIATLISYIALQGFARVLRPNPVGAIDTGLTNAISTQIGFVPVAAIVVVVMGLALEYMLLRTRAGAQLRAAGSDPQVARRVGMPVGRVTLLAYLGCAALAALGGLLLMGQVGTGDPSSGVSYTLSSITAVVLGGASVFGGRGSFIGALLGALLIEQLYSLTVFLNLNSSWQLYLLGGLTLIAVAVYSKARVGRAE